MPELSRTNIEENEQGLSDFLNTCKRTLAIHAPRKQKYAKGNHTSFINNTLSKEIMTRTRLRNNFLKDRSAENKNNAIIVYHTTKKIIVGIFSES